MREMIYPVLVGEIAKRGIEKRLIADAMGISYRAFYNKMTGITEFTWHEVRKIQETFFPEMDLKYLFSGKSN